MTVFSKMAVGERIEHVRPAVILILDRMKADESSLVQLRDDALELLLESDLLYLVVVHPRQVGVHPSNRGGSGVQADRVLNKVYEFDRFGFSLVQCSNAVLVERKQQDYEDWNIQLVAKAPHALAHVDRGTLRYFTLTTNHTFQALRVIDAELPCDNPKVCQNGRISKDLLMAKNKRVRTALTQGIADCKVVREEVEEAFPGLIELIIKADNIPAQMAHADSVYTQMLYMAQAAALTPEGTPVDWAGIVTRLHNQAPPNVDELPDLAKFVEKWSGGVADPFILIELDTFAKSQKHARNISGVIFGRLAVVEVGGRYRFRVAAVKAMASSPSKWVEKGMTTYLSTTDVQNFGQRLKPYVIQADDMMVLGRTIIEQLQAAHPNIESSMFQEHLDDFDIKLFAHVLSREHKYGKFKSLADVAGSFKQALIDADVDVTKAKAFPTTWKRDNTKANQEVASSVNPTLSRTGSLDPDHALAMLKERCCEVGAIAKHTKTEKAYVVEEIGHAVVKLRFNHSSSKWGSVTL